MSSVRDITIADGSQPDLSATTAADNPAFFKSAMQVQVRAGARVLRAASAEGVRLCRDLGVAELAVWAAVAPAGRLLVLREADPRELAGQYTERVATLAAAGPDALWFHTLSDLEEALIALQAGRDAAAGIPVGVSLALGSGPEGMETVLGVSCEEAARRLEAAGADFIGCDCRLPVDDMVLAVRLFRDASKLPIAAFPDAAQRELDGPDIVHRETPDEFAAKAESLASAGASTIGGCCGVTPQHIAALARAVG